MSPFLLALLHFLAIGGLAMILAAEWVSLRGRVDAAQAAFLVRLDGVYVLCAALALATGFARALMGDKPWAYYAANPAFHAKLGLFVLIGLISIWPTVRFFRWRRAGGADAAEVRATRRWVSAELLLLPLLPVCAVVMARGW